MDLLAAIATSLREAPNRAATDDQIEPVAGAAAAAAAAAAITTTAASEAAAIPSSPAVAARIMGPAPEPPAFVTAWPSRPSDDQPTPCAWLDGADPLRAASPPAASHFPLELPSLSTLSADYLSLNQAYYGTYAAAASAPPAGWATAAAIPAKPFSTSCRPIARFHLVCRDATSRRGGAKTVSLAFEAVTNAGRSLIHLSLRYYGYKTLLNSNALYSRDLYACVMLSRSMGFHITACSNTHELVMLSKQGWLLHTSAAANQPPIALAVDTCYLITFVSDDAAAAVRCVGETRHEDLRLEWNHAAAVASVTATPISAAAAAATGTPSWSPSISQSSQAAATPPLEPYDGPEPMQRDHALSVKASCLSCRLAKAKCDEQRPCARCVRTHRSATCVDGFRPTVAPDLDADEDMAAATR